MKKRHRKIRENVILFPDLEMRLLEKGLEKLQNKQFRQAIELLEEAKQLDSENPDVYIALVLAYYEAGYLKEAKNLANVMLKEGLGDYIQTVDLYLMILVQLHEYNEIVITIQALLEEKEIPPEKVEHFTKMLEFSKRMNVSNVEASHTELTSSDEDQPKFDIFNCEDPKEQMLMIAQLANMNIRPYVEQMKQYLKSKEGNPFLKTLLINVLKEHEYEKLVTIEKFDIEKMVCPSKLFDVQEHPQMLQIVEVIQRVLESEDPVFFEHVRSLIERHFFILYPFDLESYHNEIWAAAFHTIVYEYHGVEDSFSEICDKYGSDEEYVLDALRFIRKIEEISYPIM